MNAHVKPPNTASADGWGKHEARARINEVIRKGYFALPLLLRIPVKATMDSDAWRPLDPVDGDQGGA